MVQNEARRPRGRPRSFDEAEVLEKARGVFWDLGYAATSLDDIARATGLNRPSLYGAFGDKHALYLAALRRTCEQSLAAMTAMLGRDLPLAQLFGEFYAAAIRVYRSGEAGARGCFVVGTAVTEALDDADTRAVLADYLERTDQLFEQAFARGGAAEPRACAAMASAALHTLAIRARAGESEADLKAVAEAAVALVCR